MAETKVVVGVVDDDEGVRSLAGRILRREGYRVLEAGSGSEALERMESESIRLLLTDLVLPGLNGAELAARIRETNPDLRVVYMSGYEESELEEKGMKEVGTAYIRKPFSADVLIMMVRGALS